MSDQSPCTSCGACCAFFRVSFYWGEAGDGKHQMPSDKVEQISPHLVAMKGTNQKQPRCLNLDGVIGQTVGCSLYEKRSTSCREFAYSWEGGVHNQRCDDARAAHGIAPLPQPLEIIAYE
ncbi:YkgJ family cysteine cluster protein [Pseudomonas putida]|uniref:YkgJ family cysteine cluster protein n=1 Tax=Pseudomonas putida TaxID=303 RepID=A0A8I1EFJ9_PSEPU|nr:YkgJ family cysteine cluster protein [Pseudomonas putida]MBI6885147.1 YkgJ family cysteine cluster protein [Pseudomonas putida]